MGNEMVFDHGNRTTVEDVARIAAQTDVKQFTLNHRVPSEI